MLAAGSSCRREHARFLLPVNPPDAGGLALRPPVAADAAAGVAAPISCAIAHATPGCADSAIESCVCTNGDPTCCQNAWDALCTGLVISFACKGGCCSAGGGLGCTDPSIERCVCALDAECCTSAWDDLCVAIAHENCGSC